ncbi:MAG: transposase, partial [Flavobacteriales bacterium]
DFKRHTVKQILNQIKHQPESRREWMMERFEQNGDKFKSNESIKFWKTGNHAIELYSEKFVWEKIHYIHNNPVIEEFVFHAEDWKFSSASNYIKGNGILEEVICLPIMQKTYV